MVTGGSAGSCSSICSCSQRTCSSGWLASKPAAWGSCGGCPGAVCKCRGCVGVGSWVGAAHASFCVTNHCSTQRNVNMECCAKVPCTNACTLQVSQRLSAHQQPVTLSCNSTLQVTLDSLHVCSWPSKQILSVGCCHVSFEARKARHRCISNDTQTLYMHVCATMAKLVITMQMMTDLQQVD